MQDSANSDHSSQALVATSVKQTKKKLKKNQKQANSHLKQVILHFK